MGKVSTVQIHLDIEGNVNQGREEVGDGQVADEEISYGVKFLLLRYDGYQDSIECQAGCYDKTIVQRQSCDP